LTWFSDNDLASAVLPSSITFRDYERVLQRAKPTVSKSDLGIFEKFTEEFGEETN
jgi:vacuolar protein-sorting-associated protein 4